MKKYTLNRAVQFGPGMILGLNDEQVLHRQHLLKPHSRGRYETTAIVNFKAGEVVGVDILPKNLESAVIEPDAETPRNEKPVKAKGASRPDISPAVSAASEQAPEAVASNIDSSDIAATQGSSAE